MALVARTERVRGRLTQRQHYSQVNFIKSEVNSKKHYIELNSYLQETRLACNS